MAEARHLLSGAGKRSAAVASRQQFAIPRWAVLLGFLHDE